MNALTRENRKTVSLCLFCYNQAKYISSSVMGALAQTYTPLEIVISDDCSTDDTYDIVSGIVNSYRGPHRVVLNRNKQNIGLGGHVWFACTNIAKGDLLILTAGDDISKEDHVEVAVAYAAKYPEVSLIDFNATIIDGQGRNRGRIPLKRGVERFMLDDYLALREIRTLAPGRLIRRELLTAFPPIARKCPTEDSVLVLRSLLAGGLYRVDEELVFYRQHDANISSRRGLAKLSNQAIIEQYLNDIDYVKCRLSRRLRVTMCARIWLEFQIRESLYTVRTGTPSYYYKRACAKILTVAFRMMLTLKIFSYEKS